MKNVIYISAQTNHCFGGQGPMVVLYRGDKLVGGWTNDWVEPACEVLKVALPDADIHFDPVCEKESKELWDSIKVFSMGCSKTWYD